MTGIILVWLLASGSLWDAVQVFAWGRMWVLNLEHQTVTQALARTFSEEGMCGLCETVQAVKGNPGDQKSLMLPILQKAPLLPIAKPGRLVRAPASHDAPFIRFGDRTMHDWQTEPPVPPPRMA